MGFGELFNKWKDKKKEEKEEFKKMEREHRNRKLLEEKQKTPMQKEYDFYQREKHRDNLKLIVDKERKEREERMKVLSNPFHDNLRERNDIIFR